jgi:hypothetical protein
MLASVIDKSSAVSADDDYEFLNGLDLELQLDERDVHEPAVCLTCTGNALRPRGDTRAEGPLKQSGELSRRRMPRHLRQPAVVAARWTFCRWHST